MMKTQTQPTVIQNMTRQLGRAVAYTGGRNMYYSCNGRALEGGYPEYPSSVDGQGYVKSQCHIQFDVNVKRGQVWRMFVHYEPDDTYTVRLHKSYGTNKMFKTGKVGEVVTELKNVYCDQLQAIVERMYDSAIEKFNDGFINL